MTQTLLTNGACRAKRAHFFLADPVLTLRLAGNSRSERSRKQSLTTRVERPAGGRDKAELARLKKGLTARHTEVLPLTLAISQRAAELIDALALSHSLLHLRQPLSMAPQ